MPRSTYSAATTLLAAAISALPATVDVVGKFSARYIPSRTLAIIFRLAVSRP
jgi:hypothetical protein